MNSLLQSLRPYWERTRALLLDLIRRIEESAPFERLVTEYESLEVRQQKWIQASLALVLLLFLVLLMTMPLFSVMNNKGQLDRSRRLIGEMRAFQDQMAVVHRPAPRPIGVQSLPVGNAAETEESIKSFLGSMGLGGDESQLTPNGSGGWKIEIKELSLRQALALTFQTDAWFPAMRTDRVAIKVNPQNKELLAMELELHYAGGNPSYGPSTGGAPNMMDGGGGMNMESTEDFGGNAGGGDESSNSGGYNPSTPPRGEGNGGITGGYPMMPPPPPGMNSNMPPDDFDSDLPPPSFPEEDM